jgi:hypothetical protein
MWRTCESSNQIKLAKWLVTSVEKRNVSIVALAWVDYRRPLSHRRQPFDSEKSHAKLMKRGKRHLLFSCPLMRPQYSLIFLPIIFALGDLDIDCLHQGTVT